MNESHSVGSETSVSKVCGEITSLRNCREIVIWAVSHSAQESTRTRMLWLSCRNAMMGCYMSRIYVFMCAVSTYPLFMSLSRCVFGTKYRINGQHSLLKETLKSESNFWPLPHYSQHALRLTHPLLPVSELYSVGMWRGEWPLWATSVTSSP